jgi:phage terminase large subunit
MPTTSNRYVPYGAHRTLMRSSQRRVVFDGPKGTGKTRAALEKADAFAFLNPGVRVAFVRRYRAWLSKTVLPIFEQQVLGPGHPALSGAAASNRSVYRYHNGSTIDLLGFDRPEHIESGEYDFAVVFEATDCTEASVQVLDTRLRHGAGPYHQLILDCNPKGPRHWIADWWMREKVKCQRIPSLHKDNPKWWDHAVGDWTPAGEAYVVETLAQLEGVNRRRNYLGEWCQAEGVVYDVFTHDTNVRPVAGEPASVTIAVDDGYSDPFAALRLEWDHDGRCHVAAERYARRLSIKEKIEAVRQLGGEWADAIVYDSAAAQLGAELREHFPYVTPSDKKSRSIGEGCEMVRERMLPAGDGKPRLTVSPACVETLNEIDVYAWMTRPDGSDKDKPLDRDNHAMDALRYGVIHRDLADEAVLV